MRPINLIPQEERRSHGGVARTGPLAYIVVGALAILLIGVVALVLTSNQISDREGEVAKLETQKAAVTARADQLAPYTSFEQVALQRTQAVTELADSRFDWARVIRQLSRILPPKVYFEELTGSAGGDAGGEGGASGVTGPSLTLIGCAPGQDIVAVFVAALKEIDGVTRIGLNKSTVAKAESQGRDERVGFCSIGEKAQFEIIVAFDAAPPSPDSAQAVATEAVAETAEAAAASSETPEAAG
jgi:Tfp pilus assembly protein PilN